MKTTTRHYILRRKQNMLPRHWKTVLATALWVGASSKLAFAQVAPPSILQIDTANHVVYFEDTADPSKFATDPNLVTPVAPKNFNRALGIAAILILAWLLWEFVERPLISAGHRMQYQAAPNGQSLSDQSIFLAPSNRR